MASLVAIRKCGLITEEVRAGALGQERLDLWGSRFRYLARFVKSAWLR